MVFEWIEGFNNPGPRYTALGVLSPHDFETPVHRRPNCGMLTQPRLSGKPG